MCCLSQILPHLRASFHAIVVQIMRPSLDCIFGVGFVYFFVMEHIAVMFPRGLLVVCT
jgi:hypothetical protein